MRIIFKKHPSTPIFSNDSWLEALQAAKDLFPRELTSSDYSPSEDVFISTEKLRSRLVQEGVGETVIKECESIMLSEVSELQNKLKALQHKHIMLLDTLRQLEVLFTLSFIIFIRCNSKFEYLQAWEQHTLTFQDFMRMKLGISYLIFGLFYVFHLEFGSRMLFVFVDVMLVTMQQSQ